MLGDGGELLDGFVDLLGSGELFDAGSCDFAYKAGVFLDVRYDFGHEFGGRGGDLDAGSRVGIYLCCRLLATFGEFADFGSDNGESLARCAGACSLDGGVNGKEVGAFGIRAEY